MKILNDLILFFWFGIIFSAYITLLIIRVNWDLVPNQLIVVLSEQATIVNFANPCFINILFQPCIFLEGRYILVNISSAFINQGI